MRRISVVSLIAMMLLVLPAWAAECPAIPAGLESCTKDVMDTLKAGNTDAAKVLIKGLVLPAADTGFIDTFVGEKAKHLAEQFARVSVRLPYQLLKTYQDQLSQNRTSHTAYKLEAADDTNATGLQNAAIESMQYKVPLFGMRLVTPGDKLGMHL